MKKTGNKRFVAADKNGKAGERTEHPDGRSFNGCKIFSKLKLSNSQKD